MTGKPCACVKCGVDLYPDLNRGAVAWYPAFTEKSFNFWCAACITAVYAGMAMYALAKKMRKTNDPR